MTDHTDPVTQYIAEIHAAVRAQAERRMRLAIDEQNAPTAEQYRAHSPFTPPTRTRRATT